MNKTVRLTRNEDGSSAAEFALVLPLLLLFLFGIIDAGRFAWEYNRAEKATQVGARFAAVTDPVAPALYAYDFTTAGLNPGDPINTSALGTITCTSATCTCSGSCPTGTGATGGAWTQVLARMRQIDPIISASNLRIQYKDSGLGYAGDPNGMDIVPIVTVSLSGMQFKPITTLLFLTVTMPDFHTSLTAEDSSGSQSN